MEGLVGFGRVKQDQGGLQDPWGSLRALSPTIVTTGYFQSPDPPPPDKQPPFNQPLITPCLFCLFANPNLLVRLPAWWTLIKLALRVSCGLGGLVGWGGLLPGLWGGGFSIWGWAKDGDIKNIPVPGAWVRKSTAPGLGPVAGFPSPRAVLVSVQKFGMVRSV